MLNISNVSVAKYILPSKFTALQKVEDKKSSKVLRRLIYASMVLILVIMFLPWTQNIRSNGSIISLRPDQKPQTINSIIGGRIEKWYVQEGDFVKKGDTILKLSEIKDSYFDDQLLPRTNDQLELKKRAIETYSDKITTQEELLKILNNQRDLKLSQAKIKLQQANLKLQNDSIALVAAEVNLATAEVQFTRIDSLYNAGLKSLTDLEARNIKLQQARSYETEARNKWLNSKSELINLQIEISSISMKFQQDLNKVLSDQFSTLSIKLDSENTLSKMENQYSNYQYRNNLYFVTAPQDGYVTKTIANGIGETIKDGSEVVTIMPDNYSFASEIYIEPIDLPLVHVGEKVRLQFDGWPAIVFSGWPNASHGTYGGKIYAVDKFISPNGKFRILIEPDPDDYPWPTALRFGSGTSAMILLNDVPIWYELWRNINGFPPDFYNATPKDSKEKK